MDNIANEKQPPGLIYKKMAAILADTSAIAKTKRNAAQGFNFRGIDDVMNELHNSFATHGVFLTTQVLELTKEERQTQKGGTMVHQFQKLCFTFWAEDGSSVNSIVYGEAMDSGDKAGNKCMSIGLKYALLQAFLIPTEDMVDPDLNSHQITSDKKSSATPNNTPNPDELYCGTPQQKTWLMQLFNQYGLSAQHSQFMQDMNNAVQKMPMKQIAEYIKPKAISYLEKQKETK